MRAKCIAFAHHKGGTGKTTSCINIAGELVKRGKKVLVVDMDPQANATAGLNINKRYLPFSVYDVLLEGCGRKRKLRFRNVILATEIEDLHLAPSELNLANILGHMQKAKGSSQILDRALDDVRELYDYILIDTPPSYTPLLTNAIVAADSIILPLDSGFFSIDSIETFAEILKNIEEREGVKKGINTVIVTRFQEPTVRPIHKMLRDRVPKLSGFLSLEDPLSELEDKLRLHLSVGVGFRGDLFIVPYSKKVYEAQKRGLPLSHYRSDGKVKSAYEGITEKIINGRI
ncbi:MAG: ParA family protein [Candidatus Altiarchaeota archaeon]|nr:ParA family protein [Candidatus Altiarchaeota archaeon]